MYNSYGVLIQEGEYRNSLEQGTLKFYCNDGILEFIGDYQSGTPVGVWYKFIRGKKTIYKRY